jgi:hypothetical protein
MTNIMEVLTNVSLWDNQQVFKHVYVKKTFFLALK